MALGEYLGAGSGITKGLWHFNNAATDSSGNALTLTLTAGATYDRLSRLGSYALAMAAATDNASIADSAPTRFSTALTFSLWWNGTVPVSGSTKGFISKWATAGNNRGYQWIMSNIAGVQTIGLNLSPDGKASANDSFAWTMSPALSSSTWYHLVVVWDGTSKIPHLYVNGVLRTDPVAGTVASIFATTASFNINASGAVNSGLIGKYDEVIIENVTHTAQWVKRQYTAQLGRQGLGA